MNSLDANLRTPENVLRYMTPGVYQIHCLTNNTVYIGITQNILERFGKHCATLSGNKHDCRALQEDWNRFGQENFTFTVFCSGPEWVSITARKAKEEQVIKQRIEESYNVYNIDPKVAFEKNYKRSVSIDGIIYESIDDAVKKSNGVLSGTSIRRRLSDPDYPDYIEIARNSPTYSVQGILYTSYKEIIAAGLAANDGTVRRRLRNKNEKWSDWFII